jgi:hypothetical protein
MATQYYDALIKTLLSEGEVSQLQYDIHNAPPAMREISTKLFNVTTTLLYHCVALTEELMRLNVLQRVQPPAPPSTRAQAPQATQLTSFPAPPTLSLPRLAPPSAAAGAAPGDLTPCDVAQVVITAQGTKVIPPAGTRTAPVFVPPNTPVDLAQIQNASLPPPAPEGVNQVVLPRGGELSPEVQAALNSRQGGGA